MQSDQIYIVHIESIPDIRTFVKEGLERHGKIKIVGSSDNYLSALELIKETTPHILLVSTPENANAIFGHFKAFKKLLPSLKIILLTMHDSNKMVPILVKNGFVDGIIGEHETIPDLYNCIISLTELNRFSSSKN